jgi:hypothetical protein
MLMALKFICFRVDDSHGSNCVKSLSNKDLAIDYTVLLTYDNLEAKRKTI